MNIKTIKRIKRWMNDDHKLRSDLPGRNTAKKTWLLKAIGISGANQTTGAMRMLDFLLKSWESDEE